MKKGGSENVFSYKIENTVRQVIDRLCGLVARVLGYRSRDPGSVSGATRFSEK
jgi:hypothetical protein